MTQGHDIPALVLAAVFGVAGLTALLASLADWDWFFGTSSSRLVAGHRRLTARIFYGATGALMLGASLLLIFV